ncbi:hypothetical protein PLESTB_000351900 [Pleodorina starrii]|uniref:Uncharacterized protein n=1 Tax=Pleodorina starrii TaxID=330485 RepID=A0A9W6BDJ9_9CHLO|nr:hypothetical protein PLESTM_000043300 [Pleodorina starrii]GLC50186.1 hypothetical protein PLESTB_000351900 [Pleodorina starrii]GLC73036.1 hypothetical protein PLESTF_001324700 [Pleodorina starrii]
MVLLHVTHYVEVPSSRVPLAVIILNDAIKRKSLPTNLKCRMVIPSCGNYSSSLWDASSIDDLQQWIETNLMDGVAHIAEVPEEFTYGVALELTTSRAADKVATSSKNTLERINNTGARVMESVAEKLDRLDQHTHLISATREATSAAVGKVKQATDRALESEQVQKSLASISSGLQTASKGVGRAFSWVGTKVKETFPTAPVHGAPYASFVSDATNPPPAYEAMYSESPSGGGGFTVPVSTHVAARPAGDDAGGRAWGTNAGAPPGEEAAPPPMPQFTLDDGPVSPHTSPPKSKDGAAATVPTSAASQEDVSISRESAPLIGPKAVDSAAAAGL